MRRNVSESIAAMHETDNVTLIELVQARIHLEVPLAGLAAHHATDETAGDPRGDRSGRGQPPGIRRVSHRRCTLSPSDRLGGAERAPARVHELDPRRLQPSLIETIGASIDGAAILRQHGEIERAVRLRQRAAAERAMRRHSEYLRELIG